MKPIGVNVVHERIWTFSIVERNIHVTYMTEDKLHLKNTSRLWSQTLESYKMQNSACMFVLLSHFNYNYIILPQISFPPLLVGRLGLIIIQWFSAHFLFTVYCRKSSQEPPPLIVINFINDEETENMCRGINSFSDSANCVPPHSGQCLSD